MHPLFPFSAALLGFLTLLHPGPGVSACWASEKEDHKILVVSFSHSGNTWTLAEQIHRLAGGDLFRIKTAEAYPREYGAVVDIAKKEQSENRRPRLKTPLPDLRPYDVIFLGYPIWWGTMPMGVWTFLEGQDLSGKTILPFCTHEGSGLGRSPADLARLCPRSTLREGLAVRGSQVPGARKDVEAWVRKNLAP